MPAIKSLGELKRIREEALQKQMRSSRRQRTGDQATMGTCEERHGADRDERRVELH